MVNNFLEILEQNEGIDRSSDPKNGFKTKNGKDVLVIGTKEFAIILTDKTKIPQRTQLIPTNGEQWKQDNITLTYKEVIDIIESSSSKKINVIKNEFNQGKRSCTFTLSDKKYTATFTQRSGDGNTYTIIISPYIAGGNQEKETNETLLGGRSMNQPSQNTLYETTYIPPAPKLQLSNEEMNLKGFREGSISNQAKVLDKGNATLTMGEIDVPVDIRPMTTYFPDGSNITEYLAYIGNTAIPGSGIGQQEYNRYMGNEKAPYPDKAPIFKQNDISGDLGFKNTTIASNGNGLIYNYTLNLNNDFVIKTTDGIKYNLYKEGLVKGTWTYTLDNGEYKNDFGKEIVTKIINTIGESADQNLRWKPSPKQTQPSH